MASRRCAAGTVMILWLLAGACAALGYSPYPLVVGELSAQSFSRCREVLLRHYGALSESDGASFRLQTVWAPIADPPGERRASVFRNDRHQGELSIVVELRWLRIPMFGMPYWTTPRGDDAAERELAERLSNALQLAVSSSNGTAATR